MCKWLCVYLTAQNTTDLFYFPPAFFLFTLVSVPLRSGIIKPRDKYQIFAQIEAFQLAQTHLVSVCPAQSNFGSSNIQWCLYLSLYANTPPLKLASCLNTPLRGQLKSVSTERTKVSLHLGCPPCSVFYILAGSNDAKTSTLKSTAVSLFSGGYCKNDKNCYCSIRWFGRSASCFGVQLWPTAVTANCAQRKRWWKG